MVVSADDLPVRALHDQVGYRLVNSKYPPISLFDDVADADDFEALYALQALTNPRLQTEVGDIDLVKREDIPFGIPGCSYALAPFTHVNPEGSRFSDGQFGVLYLADEMTTAIREVGYHQERYWVSVPELAYERFVFRGLHCSFGATRCHDATGLKRTEAIYSPTDYSASRVLGQALMEAGSDGLRYWSVRRPKAVCWGLFTPRGVQRIVQTEHFEMIWDGHRIAAINRIIGH